MGDLGVTKLPDNVDLEIWRGDAQKYLIVLQNEDLSPIDLTGCTAQATIRQSFNAPDQYDFTCTIVDVAGGKVQLYMSSATCETIPAGDYVWNFQITDGAGDVRTYLAGDVVVYAEVD